MCVVVVRTVDVLVVMKTTALMKSEELCIPEYELLSHSRLVASLYRRQDTRLLRVLLV
jgi:hypothetical protein